MKQFFLVLTFFTIFLGESFAQDVYSKLTAHDGYWYWYSEREEQFVNGEYLARETYWSDEDLDVVMFDRNGQYNAMNFRKGYELECRWEMIEDKQIKLFDGDKKSDFSMLFDIVEISDNKLVLKVSTKIDGTELVKYQIFCFPDNRLSEKEADSKNKRGVFKIDGFSNILP